MANYATKDHDGARPRRDQGTHLKTTRSMNAVVTIGNIGDTITLLGVQASELHPGDFHFVDASLTCPAANSIS
jgi:hypothetical protein